METEKNQKDLSLFHNYPKKIRMILNQNLRVAHATLL